MIALACKRDDARALAAIVYKSDIGVAGRINAMNLGRRTMLLAVKIWSQPLRVPRCDFIQTIGRIVFFDGQAKPGITR